MIDNKEDKKEENEVHVEEKILNPVFEVDKQFGEYLTEISKTTMSDLLKRISKELEKVFFVKLSLYTRDFEIVSDFLKIYGNEYTTVEVIYSFPRFIKKVIYICYKKDYIRVVNVILNDKRYSVFMIDGKKVEIIFDNQEDIDKYERLHFLKRLFTKRPTHVLRQIIPQFSEYSVRLEAH